MSIINYIGINDFNINSCDCFFPFSVDGTIKIDSDACKIDDLLSFNVTNEIINHNTIEIFELTNFEDYQVNSNLAYVNTKFSLVLTYGANNTNTINAISKSFFKSFVFPIDLSAYNNVNLSLFIQDLYCKKLYKDTIFYNIHIAIAINNYF